MNQMAQGYHNNATNHYYDDISRFDLLGSDEEFETASIIHNGILTLRSMIDQVESRIVEIKECRELSFASNDSGKTFPGDRFIDFLKTIIAKKNVHPDYKNVSSLIEEDIYAIEEAKGTMLKANLRFVISIAKKEKNTPLAMADIIQEGNIGLIRAVYRFDPTKGYKFITYAQWWIRQAIKRALLDTSRTIRLPTHIQESLTQISKFKKDYPDCKLTDKEIINELGLKPDLHNTILFTQAPVMSLNFQDDNGVPIGDCIPGRKASQPAESYSKKELTKNILEILSKLPDREKFVIQKRFGINCHTDHTLSEIGIELNISRERVRQIEMNALKKIKKIIGRSTFKEQTLMTRLLGQAPQTNQYSH